MNKQMREYLKQLLQPEYNMVLDYKCDDGNDTAFYFGPQQITYEEAFDALYPLYNDEPFDIDDARFTIVAAIESEFDIMMDSIPLIEGRIDDDAPWDDDDTHKWLISAADKAQRVLGIRLATSTNNKLYNALAILKHRLIHEIWHTK